MWNEGDVVDDWVGRRWKEKWKKRLEDGRTLAERWMDGIIAQLGLVSFSTRWSPTTLATRKVRITHNNNNTRRSSRLSSLG
jgi:hypothetical protein